MRRTVTLRACRLSMNCWMGAGVPRFLVPGSVLGLALCLGTSGGPDLAGAQTESPVGETIGAGTDSDVATTGVWSFEGFSAGFTDSIPDCSFDVGQAFGDVVDAQGWDPSPGSLLPARVEMWDPTILDPEQFPDAAPSSDVGGGVLAFDDPDADGYPPHSIGWMESPVINLVELEVDADPIEVSFSSNSPPAPEITILAWVVGTRIYDGIEWSPWEDVLVQMQPGPAEYVVPFGIAADIFQVRIGVQNPSDVLIRSKAKADKAKVKTKPPSVVGETWKYVPDIEQGAGRPTCAGASTANCLAYWAKKGYPEITSDESDTTKVHDKLKEDLEKEIYGADKKVGGTGKNADSWPGGISSYLKKKGVYDGDEQPAGRSPLEHERVDSLGATWEYLCNEFEQCHDVLITFGWYDEDGNLLKNSEGTPYSHQVTMSGKVEMSNGKHVIHVANPWGDQHDEVTGSNRGEAYESMEVEVDPVSGRIKLKNEEIQKRFPGGKKGWLCVREINVVRPKDDALAPAPVFADLGGNVGENDDGRVPRRREGASAGGDPVVYGYAILNDGTEPLHTFALEVEVPYTMVTSPPGWNWAPLPQPFPGSTGCNAVIGQAGIVWSTISAPVLPGGQLSGFHFSADPIYPSVSQGVQWYTEVQGFKGLFGFVDGPVPDETSSTPDAIPGMGRGFALRSFPNPSLGEVDLYFELHVPTEVQITIFDPEGRRIRRLPAQRLGIGPHELHWDGTDDAGRRVGAGVFFYRLDAEGSRESNQVILVR